MSEKFINITFPFTDSPKGFFVNLNKDDQNAIKSDLMYLILTTKGQRLYNPEFGTNLLKFIFEPNDSLSFEDIKEEINFVVSKYLPNLTINDITVETPKDEEYTAEIKLFYTITEDAFKVKDILIIRL